MFVSSAAVRRLSALIAATFVNGRCAVSNASSAEKHEQKRRKEAQWIQKKRMTAMRDWMNECVDDDSLELRKNYSLQMANGLAWQMAEMNPLASINSCVRAAKLRLE